MAILGGFIAVAGIVTIALAFTLLNALTLGTAGVAVATVGAIGTAAGVGLFSLGFYKACTPASPSVVANLSH